jgi:hypothetical protein
MNRYTSHELTILAKQTFRKVQKALPDGGAITNYTYRGWQLLVNGGHTTMLVNYDFQQGNAMRGMLFKFSTSVNL